MKSKNQKDQDFPYVSKSRRVQIEQVFEALRILPATGENPNPYFQEFTLLKSEGFQFTTSSSSI